MIAVLIVILSVLIALFVSPVFFPVSGIWKDVHAEDYLSLETFGPFVSGKKNLLGGNAIFSGVQILAWLFLKRRDYGVQALTVKGLSEQQAKKINGCIAARICLCLTKVSGKSHHLIGSSTEVRPVIDKKNNVISFVWQPKVRVVYVLSKRDKLPASVSHAHGSSGGALSLPSMDR